MDSAAAVFFQNRSACAGIETRVNTAHVQDRVRIADVLTMAFADDPPVRWLYPDIEHYRRNFPDFVRAFGGRSVELECTHCVDDALACALWLPPGEVPNEVALVDHVVWRIEPRRHEEVFAVFEAIGRVHPTEPHWYLALIGVEPEYQGYGFGSALLKRGLERCDRDGMPAYLEATSPRNIRLYERHGFRQLAPVDVGSCPTITPMWRAPSPRVSAAAARSPAAGGRPDSM